MALEGATWSSRLWRLYAGASDGRAASCQLLPRVHHVPTHLCSILTHTANPIWGHAMQHWPTPPLETGRHLTGTWEGHCRAAVSSLRKLLCGGHRYPTVALPSPSYVPTRLQLA